MSKPTAAHAAEAAAGATFADAAGFHLPARFTGVAEEYAAAVEASALFDTSHAAKLVLTGPDAPRFVHNIATNDIKDLPLGGGCETYFCDARAKALFVAWVYHLKLGDGRNALWLETTPGRAEALVRHLDRYLISEAVEIADATDQYAQFHLAGPTAKGVLESALADDFPALAEFQHVERTFGSTAVASVRARTRLGIPGYDIVCLPERAEGVWRMLTAAGATPAGLGAYEVLRVEAGTPEYGPDIDANRFVMEVADAGRAVSYQKGCFPGQEPIVMARDRAGRVNRGFVKLRLDGPAAVPVGTTLTAGETEVGAVTSAAISPRAGAVAVGYVRWDHVAPGTVLSAAGRRTVIAG